MISKLTQHVLRFFTCQQSNSLCIIVLYNGGCKAPIRLLGRGRSCLIEKLGLECLDQYGLKGDSSCLFNPVFIQRIGLVPGNVVIVAIDMYGKSLREWIYWGYVNACILLFLFIMQTFKFFTFFSLFFVYLYVSFLLACDWCFL